MCVLALAVSACSTPNAGKDESAPVPLAVYTRDDMQRGVLAMWGASSPTALASSSFTAPERFYLFRGFLLQRLMAAPEERTPCPTIKLVSTAAAAPAPQSGAKSEVWTVDVCSASYTVTVELTADDRDHIRKNPTVTDPVL